MIDESISSVMKACTKCNRELPISSFSVDKRGKNGLRSICRDCAKSAWSLYASMPKVKDALRLYASSDGYKAIRKEYGQSDSRKRSLSKFQASVAGKAIMARYWRSDKGKALKARSRHNRRANVIVSPSTLTAQEWDDIQRQYKYRCVYCGEKKPLTRDHLIPLSKEGSFVKENIVPACHSCNAKKGNRPVLLQILAYAV